MPPRYANYFDIDWSPLKEEMRDKLLLPILGNQYGEELEAKRIQVAFEDGRFYVKYFNDHRLPASPRSIPLLFFRRPIGTLAQRTGDRKACRTSWPKFCAN